MSKLKPPRQVISLEPSSHSRHLDQKRKLSNLLTPNSHSIDDRGPINFQDDESINDSTFLGNLGSESTVSYLDQPPRVINQRVSKPSKFRPSPKNKTTKVQVMKQPSVKDILQADSPPNKHRLQLPAISNKHTGTRGLLPVTFDYQTSNPPAQDSGAAVVQWARSERHSPPAAQNPLKNYMGGLNSEPRPKPEAVPRFKSPKQSVDPSQASNFSPIRAPPGALKKKSTRDDFPRHKSVAVRTKNLTDIRVTPADVVTSASKSIGYTPKLVSKNPGLPPPQQEERKVPTLKQRQLNLPRLNGKQDQVESVDIKTRTEQTPYFKTQHTYSETTGDATERNKGPYQRINQQPMPSAYEKYLGGEGLYMQSPEKANLLSHMDEILSQNSSHSRLPEPKAPSKSPSYHLKRLKEMNKGLDRFGGIGPGFVGTKEWQEKMERKKKIKEFDNMQQLVNRMLIKPKPPAPSPPPKRAKGLKNHSQRKPSVQVDHYDSSEHKRLSNLALSSIVSDESPGDRADHISHLNPNKIPYLNKLDIKTADGESMYSATPSKMDAKTNQSPKSKRTLWRNDSDYFNQLSKNGSSRNLANKAKTISKPAVTVEDESKAKRRMSKLTAREAAEVLDYGERNGKNVMNDEYKKNLYAAKLFNQN